MPNPQGHKYAENARGGYGSSPPPKKKMLADIHQWSTKSTKVKMTRKQQIRPEK